MTRNYFSMVISAHTRNKDDIYFLLVISAHKRDKNDIYFKFYTRIYPSPMSSSLSTPRTPPVVLKQSLNKRRKICIVMTPANHLD